MIDLRLSTFFSLSILMIGVTTLYSQPASLPDMEPEYDAFDMRERNRPRYDRDALIRGIRYPEVARNREIEGVVLVGVLIDTNGAVMRTRVEMATHPVFERTARNTVEGLTFSPGRIYRKPVRVWLSILVPYSIQ